MPKGHYQRSTIDGSVNDWLMGFEVGDYAYIETEAGEAAETMRRLNTPPSRRPGTMGGRVYSCQAYTAVAARRLGEVKVLVRIERIS